MGFKEFMNPKGTAIKRALEELEGKGFTISQTFESAIIGFPRLFIDDSAKQIAVVDNFKSSIRFYKYTDIIGYEMFEDGNSVIKGSVGTSAVGALAFGAAGGIVGAATSRKIAAYCTSMQIIITVKDMDHPNITLNLLVGKAQRGSWVYKTLMEQAKKIISTLDNIKDQVSPQADSASSADEIAKFKKLLDSGAITQEEYNKKKKELLGI